MVKLNDMVAAAVVRSAALVPEQERDRFRRQMEPAVGRARVPVTPACPARAGARRRATRSRAGPEPMAPTGRVTPPVGAGSRPWTALGAAGQQALARPPVAAERPVITGPCAAVRRGPDDRYEPTAEPTERTCQGAGTAGASRLGPAR